MAYGTTDPVHLLNVRASGMSAFDDDPLHFARWAVAEGWARDRHAFVPRAAYRRYLQGALDRAARRTAGSLQTWAALPARSSPAGPLQWSPAGTPSSPTTSW